VRTRPAAELSGITLTDSGGESIPTLTEILGIVAGRVPLLVEIKDQDGAMGPDVGPLEEAVAVALRDYAGPVAVMSFNPESVARMAALAPDLPRGLTTCAFDAADWPLLPEAVRRRLREIPDIDRTGAGFISHDARDLASAAVARVRQAGLPVLCWTIRSAEAEAEARRFADNVTFEGYAAALPPA
jgi:glycerophosphoryl diester phosphodiesterase